MSDIDSDIEFDLELAAEKALSILIPSVSATKYEKSYEKFKTWCAQKKITAVDEKLLLAYFSIVFKDFKASTAWSHYSMLKTTLKVKEKIDISSFHQLTAFLKRKGDDYLAKKSKILAKTEIYRFIKDAPDSSFLVAKVTLIN